MVGVVVVERTEWEMTKEGGKTEGYHEEFENRMVEDDDNDEGEGRKWMRRRKRREQGV